MIPHKLNSKLLVLALIGIILYFFSSIVMNLKHGDALEEDVKAAAVTKEAAVEAAITYAGETLGIPVESAEAMYQSDKYATGYIVKNALKAQYEQGFQNTAPLDYWLVIANRKEGGSIRLKVSMDAPEVKGWDLTEPLGRAHDERGLTAAEKALADSGYSLKDWEYSPRAGGSTEANRFTFVSKTEILQDAPLSITVGVKSGKAVSLTTGLKVPEPYMDWIKGQEKMAQRMTWVFLLFTAAMGITALVLAIVHGKHVRWSRGILMTTVFFALYMLQNFNVSDAVLAAQGMNKDTEFIAVIIMNIIVVILAFLLAVAVWFSFLSGEQQWRKMGLNLWPRWRDPEFGRDIFYGMGRGYLICFFILGVQQIAFLIAGEAFDSFSIGDPSQSTMNMRWPYLFPATAWVAAIMEEAIYRLFGVALFKRILRNNFLALLVSSAIWGLGHTGYTIYPSYTRLFEVTLLGLIFGYAFLKYGFMTAVFAHAIMDSLLMALYLVIEEPSPANALWAVFYVALPAIIGYIIRFLHPRLGNRSPHQRPGLPPEPHLIP